MKLDNLGTNGLQCMPFPGGGYLVYLSDGDVPFFRVSFSPTFSRTGYQKKANLLEQVVKTCQRGNFVTTGYYLVKFLCF